MDSGRRKITLRVEVSSVNQDNSAFQIPLQIRPATLDDASLLAIAGARMFRDAFGADNNPSDLETYINEAFTEEKIAEEMAEPTAQFFLAVDNKDIVGYTKLRAIKFPDCLQGPTPVEMERIYVDQHCVGKGVGGGLMQHAIQAGQVAGYKTIWLGVWQKNGRAISFYKKWGFKIVGSHKFVIGTDVQTDHIMERPLE